MRPHPAGRLHEGAGRPVTGAATATASPPRLGRTPRLGFLGVGWIGRSRMQTLVASGAGSAVGVADPDAGQCRSAAALDPGCRAVASFEELLSSDIDGLVIATPSALHARQAVAALEAGIAVFCQKPLGRDRGETERVVAAARDADRLLGADLSYRHTAATARAREVLESGALGDIFELELAFHNAYGPDKPWFRERRLAGGGCLVDLGTHLADLALHLLGTDDWRVRSSRVLRGGARVDPTGSEVEDFAVAELEIDGVLVRLGCSWWLSAGRDCAFEMKLNGTDGAVAVENVEGSFYDFRCELRRGTTAVTLTRPPDQWPGRALVEWTRRLARRPQFDPAVEELVELAGLLDSIYRAAS